MIYKKNWLPQRRERWESGDEPREPSRMRGNRRHVGGTRLRSKHAHVGKALPKQNPNTATAPKRPHESLLTYALRVGG